jgi:hypothetical protein
MTRVTTKARSKRAFFSSANLGGVSPFPLPYERARSKSCPARAFCAVKRKPMSSQAATARCPDCFRGARTMRHADENQYSRTG